MRKIFFDSRWIGDHGIGRFAREIAQSSSLHGATHVDGGLSDIFDAWDPIRQRILCRKHSAFWVSPSFNCPFAWSERSIITIHDLMHVHFPEYKSIKNYLYYNLIVYPACRKSPAILTVSNYSKQVICDTLSIDGERIFVLNNGVGEHYNPDVQPHIEDRPYLLYIGNRKPHKNLHRVIKSFSLSKAKNSHLLLLSGYPCAFTTKCALSCGVINQVRFAGLIDEHKMPAYYKGATATLLPSLYEGFGLPILESMAVGTPIITSNITAMPEIAGGCAILVDPYSVESISSGIDRLLADQELHAHLSKKGILHSMNFNWDQTRKAFNNIISNTLC